MFYIANILYCKCFIYLKYFIQQNLLAVSVTAFFMFFFNIFFYISYINYITIRFKKSIVQQYPQKIQIEIFKPSGNYTLRLLRITLFK